MYKHIILLTMFGLLCYPLFAQNDRPIDGFGTNADNPDWGAATAPFMRITSMSFGDGYSSPGGTDRPNPRYISLMLGQQTTFIPNEMGLSDYIWGWGQFIDHDINLNDDHPTEFIPISVPAGDPSFDPDATGTVQIPMRRSLYDPATGDNPSNPRIHMNEITSYIDASTVYGVDAPRMDWMRTFQDGKLKTSAGNILPFNTLTGEIDGALDNDAPFMLVDGVGFSEKLYVAGDIRANEQPGLTCFHVLWVREHNRLCDEIKTENPTWTDAEIFHRARKMVGAYIQAITYEEWLPTFGIQLPAYQGYDASVNPSIFNVFSAAAYRFGHTMVNGRLMRYEENGDTLSYGSLNLRDGFFNTDIVHSEDGIEPFFRGMASQQHQFVDVKIVSDLQNFLFGPPGAGGLDLLAININRARERGVTDYNTIREEIGLASVNSFSEITSDTDLANRLSTIYSSIDRIDPWIGFMAEDHLPNSVIGESLMRIFSMQFQNLRDGDRYYYENDPMLTAEELLSIKNTRLSDVIKRNTSIESIQDNVFIAENTTVAVELTPFENIRDMRIDAYPNPIQKYFTLTINAFNTGTAELSVVDNLGRVGIQRQVALVKGENTLEFELDDSFAAGLYTITLKSNDNFGQLKIVKK